MNNYKTIEIELVDEVCTIWLNRPEIHNAFNEQMIFDLTDAFNKINEDKDTRVVIIRGKGKSFCAGADLHWLGGVANYSREENYKESLNLSKCFYRIYTCKKPTIAVVHGAAIGGANGIIAACDLAYAETNTKFSLSEVKIGIVPACISPYVVKRVGEYVAKEMMLTGRRFLGQEAENNKLVNKSLGSDKLGPYVDSIVALLKTSGPHAITHCKNLIYNISNTLDLKDAMEYTAKMIADIRSSKEGREGMAAFLEKRKPSWVE